MQRAFRAASLGVGGGGGEEVESERGLCFPAEITYFPFSHLIFREMSIFLHLPCFSTSWWALNDLLPVELGQPLQILQMPVDEDLAGL